MLGAQGLLVLLGPGLNRGAGEDHECLKRIWVSGSDRVSRAEWRCQRDPGSLGMGLNELPNPIREDAAADGGSPPPSPQVHSQAPFRARAHDLQWGEGR
jgi:hypothetical protein